MTGHAFASKKRKAQCTAVGEPENAVKRRKALGLLSEEELLVRNLRDKVRKASKRASETRERTLHRQEQNRTHMASINTYHIACAEGSALQCCSCSTVIILTSPDCVIHCMACRMARFPR